MLRLSCKASEVLHPKRDSEHSMSAVDVITNADALSIGQYIFANSMQKPKFSKKIKDFLWSLEYLDEPITSAYNICNEINVDNVLKFHGLRLIPTYSDKVANRNVLHKSSESRNFTDAKDYFDNGTPTAEEMRRFLRECTRDLLKPLFSKEEIKSVYEESGFVETLLTSTSREDVLFDKFALSTEFEIAKKVAKSFRNCEDAELIYLYKDCQRSTAVFLIHFGLHLIKKHFQIIRGVDYTLKMYAKDMYKKAIEDSRRKLRESALASKDRINVKETNTERTSSEQESGVKIKKQRKPLDENFEMVKPPTKKKRKLARTNATSQAPNGSGLSYSVEEEIWRQISGDAAVPLHFKLSCRAVLDHNAGIRKEIDSYNEMSQLIFAKKLKAMNQ